MKEIIVYVNENTEINIQKFNDSSVLRIQIKDPEKPTTLILPITSINHIALHQKAIYIITENICYIFSYEGSGSTKINNLFYKYLQHYIVTEYKDNLLEEGISVPMA